MKALPLQQLREGDWLYEIKYDGCRAPASKDCKDVTSEFVIMPSPSKVEKWHKQKLKN
jgi:hypothetical protein